DECNCAGHGGGKWPADHAHGFAQGLRSRWFCFLHELPERKGPAPGKKSARGSGHSLEGTGATNPNRWHRRKSLAGRIVALFSFATDRQSAWRVGFTPKRGH